MYKLFPRLINKKYFVSAPISSSLGAAGGEPAAQKDNKVSSLAHSKCGRALGVLLVPRTALGDLGAFAHRRHSQSDKPL